MRGSEWTVCGIEWHRDHDIFLLSFSHPLSVYGGRRVSHGERLSERASKTERQKASHAVRPVRVCTFLAYHCNLH